MGSQRVNSSKKSGESKECKEGEESKSTATEFIEIKGFVENSLVDWDGKVASVIWLPHCTFRCPWCFARDLVLEPEKLPTISFNEVTASLAKNKKFVDGVVVTGGEPTMHLGLPELCKRIHDMGFLVKLDTNGSNPAVLKGLVENKLVDYVAMDVKAPLEEEEYDKINGGKNFLPQVKESIAFLLEARVDYEFRTTLVPGLHFKETVEKMGEQLASARKWALQKFIAPESGKLVDQSLEKNRSFTDDEMRVFLEAARVHCKNAFLRGV